MNKIIDIEIKKIDKNYSYFKINHINEEKFNNLIYKNNRIWINNEEYNISRNIYNIFYLSENSEIYYFSISEIKENQNRPTIIINNIIENLKKIIEFINSEKENKREKKQKFEKYYFINLYGKIEEGLEDDTLETKKRFEYGNYFMSKKEIKNFINSYEYQELWNNVKRGKYFNMEE
ncbi:hypothetical protein [Fusobacterium periodonticum]|uniref:Uncharacterized protein n=1 Tax=Fusobacterium periodonticum ATCC 33693 TaxID=546275 RepID=D4CXF8_9FUSO|nr:hypothetical protein [Fusobacterium periodonticum]EFE86078.1 hypothetical protein FUSPEROL_02119 [Fusobacterium periodonticum ATCC 33693]